MRKGLKVYNIVPWPTKHGKSGSKEYRTWVEVKRRCLNKNSKDFKKYGGSGISIDPLFIQSFQSFLDEVGLAPTDRHSIDRIDTTKGYVLGNMRWSTITEQNRNKRTSFIVTIDGVDYDGFNAAAIALGVSNMMIYYRCKGHFDKRFNHYSPPKPGYSYRLRYKVEA